MAAIMPDHSQDLTLIQRALTGEPDAGARLVQRLTPIVRARIARSVSARGRRDGRVHIDDLVQDVFVRLFATNGRALRAWRSDGGLSLRGFAALLAQREVATALRASERRTAREQVHDTVHLDAAGATDAPCAETVIAHRNQARQLFTLVQDHLGPRGREVFQRLYVRADSPRAICEALGMTLTAVYQWRRRLAALMREHAGRLEDPRRLSGRGGGRVHRICRSRVSKLAAAANNNGESQHTPEVSAKTLGP